MATEKKAPAKKTTTKKAAVKPTVKKTEEISSMHSLFTGKYFYSNGKRKTSISRVRLYEKGEGKIIINGQDASEYFSSVASSLEMMKSPLKTTGNEKTFNITAQVQGGGMLSQLDSVRHGIAKALVVMDEGLKPSLKKEGQLTRDSRIKERKKPGLKRARKAPTWVKR